MPLAHADPDDGIRNAVTSVRSKTPCPPLYYKLALEGAAGNAARTGAPGVDYGGVGPDHVDGYDGKPAWYFGIGDPAAKAIDDAMSEGASGAISDCSFTDYGVGFWRHSVGGEDQDNVIIVLGRPAPPPVAPPAPPSPSMPPPAGILGGPNHFPVGAVPVAPPPSSPVSPPPTAPVQPTATVTSDVDLYDVPGGNGKVIGVLRQGQVVTVVKPCPSDDWCNLASPNGAAWGQFFKNN